MLRRIFTGEMITGGLENVAFGIQRLGIEFIAVEAVVLNRPCIQIVKSRATRGEFPVLINGIADAAG